MKNKLLNLALAGLILSSSSLINVANATLIAYTGGHSITTAAATAGGVTVVGSPSGFGVADATLSAVIGGSLGAFDALVVGENLTGISATGKATFSSYIAGGGHGVVLGAHGSEASFLNSTFGFSVAGQSPAPSSYDGGAISRVAGTGPATLKGLNGSWYLDELTLPTAAISLYTRDTGGAAGFVMPIGMGTLSWLAWDFCDCGEPLSDQADWYSVLGEEALGAGTIDVPEPTSLAIFALGLMGLASRRVNKKS